MRTLAGWFRQNRLLIFLLSIFIFLLVTGIWLWNPSDPLNELKNKQETDLPPDAEKAVRQALKYIEKHDMKSLFKIMVSQDGDFFQGVYVNGLFATKDFCPAELIEMSAQRLTKSSVDHVIVQIYSKPRNKYYSMGLHKIKGQYNVSSIIPSTLN